MIEQYCPIRNTNAPDEMKTVLKDNVSVYHHPRRQSYSDQNFVDEQVREWLKDGIIQISTSEYDSPVVLVAKKNGKKRLCCDFCNLNDKIIRDNFPMAQCLRQTSECVDIYKIRFDQCDFPCAR